MNVVPIVKRLPLSLQRKALWLLYLRKGKHLGYFEPLNGGQFYVYKVNGKYLPSDTFNWFVDFEYYNDQVNRISAFEYRPQPGDVIIDIGAGIGEETLVYSDLVGSNGKVYSIEANPEVFQILSKVVELNGKGNVEVFNIAVNKANENVEIEINENSFVGSTIGGTKKGKSYSIPGVRMDDFFTQHTINKVNLLKVNIEGAERFVFETIGHFIDKVQNVAIACHDFRFNNEPEKNPFFITKNIIIEYLVSRNFVVSTQKSGIPCIDDWVYGKRA